MTIKNIIIFIILLYDINAFGAEREEYEISIQNHFFKPEVVHVKPDTKIKLIVYNQDDTVEEFESIDLRREKIVAPHSKIHLLIGPLKKGEYRFFGDFNQKTAQGKIIVD